MVSSGRLLTTATAGMPDAVGAVPPRPLLALRVEPVLLLDEGEERLLPVLELGFRYGEVTVRAADPGERLFISCGSALGTIPRDHAAEVSARRLLERFGAVEIACLEHVAPALGSTADYLVDLDGNVHACCAFSAYALPQLSALGWAVEVAAGYPYRIVDAELPWYVALAPPGEGLDWFGLELGITIDGRRVSLLPALLALLDLSPAGRGLDGLVGLSARCLALPIGDGRYLPLPPERLRRILAVVRDLYDGSATAPEPSGRSAALRPELGLPPLRAAALADLDRAFAQAALAVSWHGGGELRALGDQLANGPDGGPDAGSTVASGLCATLRPYQQLGVRWLQHLRAIGLGGVLADDMGLGKTLQTIAHLAIEKEAGRLARPALVVAPTSLVPGWEREIRRFAPELRTLVLPGPARQARLGAIDAADVVLTSYGLLWRDRQRLEEAHFSVLVLDEAQLVKNAASLANRAARALRADWRLCLTGTPLENHLGELFSIFDLLVPGLLGSREEFRTRFRLPIELGDGARLAELRRRVAPFILRRLKREVASELPPKTEIVRPVELSEAERELYESIRVAAHAEVRQLIRARGLAAATVPVLGALLKLRQACCHPRLVRVSGAREVRGAAKYAVLQGLLRLLVDEGRHVLVFSQFARMLAIISEGLLAAGIRHVTLTGATVDRQSRIDAFQQGRAEVFLVSLRAGGTGLTLTAADTVIHYDPWWNPAVQSQATDRAHRIGQDKPVFVYQLIVAGSVEERMLALQQRKQQLADAVLGAGPATTTLSLAQVEELLAPLGAD